MLLHPELGKSLQGEESNKFTSSQGETICVEVQSTQEKTAWLLERVLGGNVVAARKLAQIVHSNPEVCEDTELSTCPVACVSSLGIWIDPIDSTSEYIAGKWGDEDEGSGIVTSGLQCVSVLIGVYDRGTGRPVAGVVNQPFHHLDEHNRPVGRCYWGLALGAQQWHSRGFCEDEDPDPLRRRHHPRVLLSASESSAVVQALEAAGCEVRFAAGAGYKLLCVALLRADAYLVTQGTTFRWDTCAPHALLLARNMGLFAAVEEAGVPWRVPAPVSYADPDDELCDKVSGAALWRNSRCLFACRNSFNSRLVFDALRASSVKATSTVS
ncbi:inositol polyphosphate 1-phosphatase isoform X3 [Rhipicephalus microplus]|uniref:inositol polyphosphate 1-phosphatase isoform X3 n=1 Tax=Rhipicephalus microplus TaxID=6941 RepID=UPI003F6CE0BC